MYLYIKDKIFFIEKANSIVYSDEDSKLYLLGLSSWIDTPAGNEIIRFIAENLWRGEGYFTITGDKNEEISWVHHISTEPKQNTVIQNNNYDPYRETDLSNKTLFRIENVFDKLFAYFDKKSRKDEKSMQEIIEKLAEQNNLKKNTLWSKLKKMIK
jgi:hypothetical protein